ALSGGRGGKAPRLAVPRLSPKADRPHSLFFGGDRFVAAFDQAAEQAGFFGDFRFGGGGFEFGLCFGFQPFVEAFVGLGGAFAFVVELGVGHFSGHDGAVPEGEVGFKRDCWMVGSLGCEKVFFFVNKKEVKKLCSSGPVPAKAPMPQINESFLLLFSKKEVFLSLHFA
ncbi:hypothetical protein, partial [Acidiphilium sp.]|uniref:hypothetical protein n=1 Tax=Acidiphilium sp. TaxID=527 RepID=UPI00258BDBD3